ncbi:hypothetical protein Tco_1265946 [Tanacetum coccineum]
MAGNTVKDKTLNFGKFDKFEGHDFRRWQKKMHFLLTTLKGSHLEWYFDVYTNVESAKELWDSLESKYMTMDSSSKKFLVLDNNIQHGFVIMDESISVSSIIDKLPPSWKDFKHTLKYGKDDLSLVKHGSHLHIEESLRERDNDKGKGKEVGRPSVNMTEEGKNKHNKQNKGKKQ